MSLICIAPHGAWLCELGHILRAGIEFVKP